MLVGCLWQNDYLVTVSLGGTISIFSASDLEKSPLLSSGRMKIAVSLAVLNNNPKVILSSNDDGLIIKWIQGVGYSGKLQRKENSQITCFAASEEEIGTSGFDKKIWRVSLQGDQCGDANSVDIGSQPKDLSLNLGFPVTASAIAPDGSEAIIDGQDGKLHIYSISRDTLTEEAVLEKQWGGC